MQEMSTLASVLFNNGTRSDCLLNNKPSKPQNHLLTHTHELSGNPGLNLGGIGMWSSLAFTKLSVFRFCPYDVVGNICVTILLDDLVAG